MGAMQCTKMTTHTDCIFCDSMWTVEKGKSNLLTVVIVNEHCKLVLGAACVTSQEGKQQWMMFFQWIKTVIPTFHPLCVVTDGATYIFDAFKAAVPGTKAKNIVCWCH